MNWSRGKTAGEDIGSKGERELYQNNRGCSKAISERCIVTKLEQTYSEVQEAVQKKIDQWMPSDGQMLNIFDVIGNSINVMEQGLARSNMDSHSPDILIEADLRQIGIFDFHQARPAIEAGYTQMRRKLDELKQILAPGDGTSVTDNG